jgi:hypothetical protein
MTLTRTRFAAVHRLLEKEESWARTILLTDSRPANLAEKPCLPVLSWPNRGGTLLGVQ